MYGLWGKSDPAIRGVEIEKKDVEPGTVQSYCLFSTKHVFNFPVIDTTKYEIRKDPGPFSSGFGCHCKNTHYSNFVVEKCFSKNVDIFFKKIVKFLENQSTTERKQNSPYPSSLSPRLPQLIILYLEIPKKSILLSPTTLPIPPPAAFLYAIRDCHCCSP